MTTEPRQAMDWVRNLGSVAEMQAASKRGATPRLRTNAHVHLPPNFSAFANVRQAVALAKAEGISVLGASNYYDYAVYEEFAAQARAAGIFPLFGIEIIALIEALVRDGTRINDPGNPGKIYVCGKGITRFSAMTAEAARLLDGIRRNDARRMATMIDKLEEFFARQGLATGLTEDFVIDRVAAGCGMPRVNVFLQERHVCQAFQERFFELVPPPQRAARLATILGVPPKTETGDAVKIQNEIRSQLMKSGKPAFVLEEFVSFDEARRLVLELGGIPCYPTLADGTRPICGFEEPVGQLIARLKSMSIYCAELIPVRNSPEVLARYVTTMRRAGLIVTGGTEHNMPDLLPLELRCANGEPIPDDVEEIFREGACVVAGHQFLSSHGECGYVEAAGNPNPAWSNDNERIAAFHRLGAAVIARFQEARGTDGTTGPRDYGTKD